MMWTFIVYSYNNFVQFSLNLKQFPKKKQKQKFTYTRIHILFSNNFRNDLNKKMIIDIFLNKFL